MKNSGTITTKILPSIFIALFILGCGSSSSGPAKPTSTDGQPAASNPAPATDANPSSGPVPPRIQPPPFVDACKDVEARKADIASLATKLKETTGVYFEGNGFNTYIKDDSIYAKRASDKDLTSESLWLEAFSIKLDLLLKDCRLKLSRNEVSTYESIQRQSLDLAVRSAAYSFQRTLNNLEESLEGRGIEFSGFGMSMDKNGYWYSDQAFSFNLRSYAQSEISKNGNIENIKPLMTALQSWANTASKSSLLQVEDVRHYKTEFAIKGELAKRFLEMTADDTATREKLIPILARINLDVLISALDSKQEELCHEGIIIDEKGVNKDYFAEFHKTKPFDSDRLDKMIDAYQQESISLSQSAQILIPLETKRGEVLEKISKYTMNSLHLGSLRIDLASKELEAARQSSAR